LVDEVRAEAARRLTPRTPPIRSRRPEAVRASLGYDAG